MISHFPDPYPDELFYSIAARFAERMKYPTEAATMNALFGARHGVPAIDLPHKLELLVSALPFGHGYSTDMLIDNHTLLPFYGPFLAEKTYERLRANMKSSCSRITQMLAGIHAAKIRPTKFLRTCPSCDAENIEKYGETYWCRLFQIAGVEVCPTHKAFLQPTDVRRRDRLFRHQLFTAQAAERSSAVTPIDVNNRAHAFLLQIATNAAELLQTPRRAVGLQRLRVRYQELIRAKGLGARHRVRLGGLRDSFVRHFSPRLLKHLQCPVTYRDYGGWLANSTRKSHSGVAPLRHLLLMIFFEQTPSSFFCGIENPTAKSRPVHPCLNLICAHFTKPVIRELQYKRHKGPMKTFAVFRCPHCHHTSSRSVDGGHIGRVIDYGPKWNEQLAKLWADKSLSLRNIANELGADVNTIRRRAAKLELTFPRTGPRITRKKPYLGQPQKPKYTTEERRTEWLKLRMENPALSRQELRELRSNLYTWLVRHDKPWFQANAPARKPTFVGGYFVVAWNRRDEDLATLVMNAAMAIKNLPGRARRVSISGLARELGAASQFSLQLDKLPLTRLALESVVENREQFAIRRLRQAIEKFISIRERPNQTELAYAAGISYSTTFPAVRSAIDAGLFEIETRIALPTLSAA
jgi:transposase-like protein